MNRSRRWMLGSWFVLVVAVGPALGLDVRGLDARGAGRHSGDAALFSAEEYHANIEYLASDALEGRGTGQPGNDKAAEFIAEWFKKCGVKPGGDEGTYFQNFTLKIGKKIGEGTRLAVGTEGRRVRRPAKLKRDYVPLPFSGNGAFKGDVVFAGYGITNEEAKYDDYAGLDAKDKVVLALRRGPKFGEFGMAESSFRAKGGAAREHGAAAVLIVNPPGDEEGDRLFDFDGDSGGGFGMRGGAFGPPMIHVTREFADRLLKAGGLADSAALAKKIEDMKKPVSAALKGVSVRGEVKVESKESPARNVVGVIPGSGPHANEYIILGGHFDHLGIRHKGEPGFNPVKDISNGADDNASGTALVMTLAKVFTEGARPSRSLLLICFTGEERGLLGSQHFASHPTVDLKKVTAMFNFDMVGRLKNDKLEIGGMKTGGFSEMVERLAKPYGLVVKDGGGGVGPSDHASFYRKNIPVLFFFTGLHKQYHQPEDDTPLINTEGAMRIARLAADCIDEVDGRAEKLAFAKDSRSPVLESQDGEQASGGPGEGRRGRPGRGDRPRLGITPDSDDQPGVLVGQVADDSPAEKAGIKEGDRIVGVGDKKVAEMADLLTAMSKFKRGDTTKIVVKRDGKELTLDVQLGDRAKMEAKEVAAGDAASKAEPGPAPVETGRVEQGAVKTSELLSLEKATALEIDKAKAAYDEKLNEIDVYEMTEDIYDRPAGLKNVQLSELERLVTDEEMQSFSLRQQYDGVKDSKLEDVPLSPGLQKELSDDPRIRMLEDRLCRAEEAMVEASAMAGADDPKVKAAKAVRDFAVERLSGEQTQRLITLQGESVDRLKHKFIESQDRLMALKERLFQARSEFRDTMTRSKRYERLREEAELCKRQYESLIGQERLLKAVPNLARLAETVQTAMGDSGSSIEASVRYDLNQPNATFEIVIRPKAKSSAESTRKAVSPDALARSSNDQRDGAKKSESSEQAGGRAPRANDSGELANNTLPPVRLGIMPSYGESDGEGYEISGVVDGGPAAKAGMKDSDRIYMIGKDKVKDVYSYMDALRKYKPGDEVKVTVIREGKKVTLKVKSAVQKSREAA